MAQPSAFVPAWKRLGLKLKKFEEAPEANGQEPRTQDRPYSAQHEGALQEDSNSGRTSHDQVTLGKRKHHSDAADDEGASVKKSKHDWRNTPTTGDAVAAPEADFQKTIPTASKPAPADGAQPKGDPNYRKKKGGDPSYRKKKVTAPEQSQNDRLAPPKAARTPSLSPGRTVSASHGSTLLPSTETGSVTPSSLVTPQRQRSTQNSHSTEVAQFSKPPAVHIANSNPPSLLPIKAPTPGKSNKKDPSRYLNYLALYYQDRGNWKFNKATQNDVLENSLNIFRIPEEYLDALLEYVRGLQGAGVIERLRERCRKTIDEVDEEIRKESMEEREAMKEAALQERLSNERKRRQTDADVESMADHEYPEGYVRRLKRSRAEALCRALDIAMPSTTPHNNGLRNGQSRTIEEVPVVAQSKARTRKRRTDVSSDESSDSSSSEEEDSSSDDSSSDEDSSDDPVTVSSASSGDSSASESDSD